VCTQIHNKSSAHNTYFHLLIVNEISAHSVNIFDKWSFNCLSFFAPILITSNLKWQKLLSIVSLCSFKTHPTLRHRHLLAHCTNQNTMHSTICNIYFSKTNLWMLCHTHSCCGGRKAHLMHLICINCNFLS
jgi:hypothetical protein